MLKQAHKPRHEAVPFRSTGGRSRMVYWLWFVTARTCLPWGTSVMSTARVAVALDERVGGAVMR
jgi:hypothetical protein